MTDSQSICLGIKHPCRTCDQILLPVGMLPTEIWGLVSAGHLFDDGTGLQFAMLSLDGLSHAEPVTILYFLIWDSPNLEVEVPVFINPRNRVAKLYPQALGFLYIASFNSQGCYRMKWFTSSKCECISVNCHVLSFFLFMSDAILNLSFLLEVMYFLCTYISI
jgi:hypothetical protein